MRSSVAFLLCCLASSVLGASLDEGQAQALLGDDLLDLVQSALRCFNTAAQCGSRCGSSPSCRLVCAQVEAKCYCATASQKVNARSQLPSNSSSSLTVLSSERRNTVLGSSNGATVGFLDAVDKVTQCMVSKASSILPCIQGCMRGTSIDVVCVGKCTTATKAREVLGAICECGKGSGIDDELQALVLSAVQCFNTAAKCASSCQTSDSCRLPCAKAEAKCYCATADMKVNARSRLPSNSSLSLTLTVLSSERRNAVLGSSNRALVGRLDTTQEVTQCMEDQATSIIPCITGCTNSRGLIDLVCVDGCTTAAKAREVLKAICPCSAATFQQSMFLVLTVTLVSWLSNKQ